MQQGVQDCCFGLETLRKLALDLINEPGEKDVSALHRRAAGKGALRETSENRTDQTCATVVDAQLQTKAGAACNALPP